MHAFVLITLALSVLWAGLVAANPVRGFVLWLALVLTVSIGEVARAIAGACFGLTLRRVLLLPTGGGSTFQAAPHTRTPRALLVAAPVANMLFGLAVAGVVLTVAPRVVLLDPHWVTPEHLLRSLVWLNLVLGVVNLLPSASQGGAAFGITAVPMGRGPGQPPAILANGVPLAAIVLGMVLLNWWIVFAGLALLLLSQFLRVAPAAGVAVPAAIRVRDVMQTDFTVISASATLSDALEVSRHTLQQIFPVVRGGILVGAVARQQVENAFTARGEGYLQGIMTRHFAIAVPDDALPEALDRLAADPSATSMLMPVLDPLDATDPESQSPRIVGILTPHHLRRSVQLFQAGAQARARRNAAPDELP